ncbi:MAG: 50S ribosomal protein L24 [Patescibacteria group bacterium]
MMRIKKNDTVQIIAGKDKGKTGKVISVDTERNMVLVDGINMYKKNVRPKKEGQKGEIVSLARPLNAAKVLPYCSSCKKGVRVGMGGEKGSLSRVCKKCGKVISS